MTLENQRSILPKGGEQHTDRRLEERKPQLVRLQNGDGATGGRELLTLMPRGLLGAPDRNVLLILPLAECPVLTEPWAGRWRKHWVSEEEEAEDGARRGQQSPP